MFFSLKYLFTFFKSVKLKLEVLCSGCGWGTLGFVFFTFLVSLMAEPGGRNIATDSSRSAFVGVLTGPSPKSLIMRFRVKHNSGSRMVSKGV